MTAASYSDIALAGLQGSIVEVQLESGITHGSGGFTTQSSPAQSAGSLVFFSGSLAVLVAGIFTKRRHDKKQAEIMKEPLVGGDYEFA
jgi:hypothetical protein